MKTVKYGDKGDSVKELQSFLNLQGFDLKIDGVFGPLTFEAWMKYSDSSSPIAKLDTCIITLKRIEFTNSYTMGQLFLNG